MRTLVAAMLGTLGLVMLLAGWKGTGTNLLGVLTGHGTTTKPVIPPWQVLGVEPSIVNSVPATPQNPYGLPPGSLDPFGIQPPKPPAGAQSLGPILAYPHTTAGVPA